MFKFSFIARVTLIIFVFCTKVLCDSFYEKRERGMAKVFIENITEIKWNKDCDIKETLSNKKRVLIIVF